MIEDYEKEVNKTLVKLYYKLKNEFIQAKKNYEESLEDFDLDMEIKDYLHMELKSCAAKFKEFNDNNEKELTNSLMILDCIKTTNFIKNKNYHISIDLIDDEIKYTLSEFEDMK